MSSQAPQGAKRNISAMAGNKENTSPDNILRPRLSKTPKLSSLQLDKLYKDLRKESNLSTKSLLKPNLKTTRKHGPAPSSQIHQQMADLAQLDSSQPSTSDWELPKKTTKFNTKPPNEQAPAYENNRFQLLSNEIDMDVEDNTPIIGSTATNTNSKIIKQPPIYTVNTDINALIVDIATASIPKSAFIIKETSKNNHIIYASTADHYKTITDLLINNKTQFYTYTPKNLKPKSIIIKGIRGNFTIDAIKQEISDLNIPEVDIINLTKFEFDKTRTEAYHYLLQISNTSKTKDLFKIKSLAYQRIRWEYLRKPSIFQCRKCQRLGHASKNCYLQYRCVKCANSHEPGNCPIPKDNNKLQLKCANCGQDGHPASYKGCPYIKFAQQQKKLVNETKTKTYMKKINNINSTIREDRTFAQAVADKSQEHPPYQRKTAHWIPQPQDPETPFNPDKHPHQQERTQEHAHPSWLSDLKKEIAEIISSQFRSLSDKVNENSHKIEFILNVLNSNNNV